MSYIYLINHLISHVSICRSRSGSRVREQPCTAGLAAELAAVCRALLKTPSNQDTAMAVPPHLCKDTDSLDGTPTSWSFCAADWNTNRLLWDQQTFNGRCGGSFPKKKKKCLKNNFLLISMLLKCQNMHIFVFPSSVDSITVNWLLFFLFKIFIF